MPWMAKKKKTTPPCTIRKHTLLSALMLGVTALGGCAATGAAAYATIQGGTSTGT